MTHRPLPTIIGPTENALRELLTRTLGVTRIDGYDEWVYLNMTAGGATIEQIALALRLTRQAADTVGNRLATKGMLSANTELTEDGRQQLAQGRDLVSVMTERLTVDLEPERQRICAEVLDVIRERADRELAPSLQAKRK